jgi:hypothetical protein
MTEAADFSERIRLGAPFLEATLEQHRAKEREIELSVGGLRFDFLFRHVAAG